MWCVLCGGTRSSGDGTECLGGSSARFFFFFFLRSSMFLWHHTYFCDMTSRSVTLHVFFMTRHDMYLYESIKLWHCTFLCICVKWDEFLCHHVEQINAERVLPFMQAAAQDADLLFTFTDRCRTNGYLASTTVLPSSARWPNKTLLQ